MKKFVIIVFPMILLVLGMYVGFQCQGWYIDWKPNQPITAAASVTGDAIYLSAHDATPFVFKGVNMGTGIPGEWSTTYAIDKETYKKWFGQMQEMGANTVRIYAILNPAFYEALYEYNTKSKTPLYLLQGVWVNDKVQNSHMDAFHSEFMGTFQKDCKMAVDVVHGNRTILTSNTNHSSGVFRRDVSDWTIGYIIGVEWEDVTVAYTNEKHAEDSSYEGSYLYTSKEASPFERMLTEVGDQMISYETDKYKEQRLLAFANWPTTDPFTYPEAVTQLFMKCAQVDVEHILTTDAFLAGQFASYHVYPYYPDYLNFEEDLSIYTDSSGQINTYQAYLKRLTEHHTIPVVISEFGVSTGRGIAQKDQNTGRNQGNMSESEQGEAIIRCYEDILEAGCQGGCVFAWQDEWFKRTWNTMLQIDLKETPYWSDYQTNEQYFGLLSFDPGEETCVCYVDGDISDWEQITPVMESEDESMSLSMQYDEKFIYFLLYKKDYDSSKDVLYVPIDTTQKSGTNYSEQYDIRFEKAADFLMKIEGSENSHVYVQERYEVMRAMYGKNVYGENPYIDIPQKDSPIFKPIELVLQIDNETVIREAMQGTTQNLMRTFETGKLTYGNANPQSEDFNSLADFITSGDYTEVKLPWQLLNFNTPSKMQIHDDYYEKYGVETLPIDEMYVGIGQGESKERIAMRAFELKPWGTRVTSHERLKQSYDILKEYWTGSSDEDKQ